MTTRTDIHRSSAIDPSQYAYVGILHMKIEHLDDCFVANEERRRCREHMDRTGGRFSTHEHGGTCDVCGANAKYLVLFHHVATNEYLRLGNDCAAKLDMGCAEAFRAFKRSIDDARKLQKGRMKAKAILGDAGHARAWELFCDIKAESTKDRKTLISIIAQIVRRGSASEKQLAFVGELAKRVDNSQAYEADRLAKIEAERLAAQDCPSGKVAIRGRVLSTRVDVGMYGEQFKMLVQDERGFKVWGTIPSSLLTFACRDAESYEFQRSLARGDVVSFVATVEPKSDDPKFGIFKRPTKAVCETVNDPACIAAYTNQRRS